MQYFKQRLYDAVMLRTISTKMTATEAATLSALCWQNNTTPYAITKWLLREWMAQQLKGAKPAAAAEVAAALIGPASSRPPYQKRVQYTTIVKAKASAPHVGGKEPPPRPGNSAFLPVPPKKSP